MYKKRTVSLFIIFMMIFAFKMTAQDDSEWYLDKPIINIRFKGLKTVSETELKGIVREYISQNYSYELFLEIQTRLYALDYFEMIIPNAVAGDPNKNSVVLEFQVKERPVIDEIIFSGNSQVKKRELKEVILLNRDDMISKNGLKQDEEAIRNLYKEKGFLNAEVSSETFNDEENNAVSVSFIIDEGNQTKISNIYFVGNEKLASDKTLQGLMKTKPQGFLRKGLLVENELQEDLKEIERYYQERGYIDAEVIDVVRETVLIPDENLMQMEITIKIFEGDQYTYTGTDFSGNILYTDEELSENFQLSEGRIFNRSKFQIDFESVTGRYFENGYIYNQFVVDEHRDEDQKTVSFTINITEYEKTHIENIIIEGNTKTKDEVILREIPLEPGDVFSHKKVYEGWANLMNLQFFEGVDYKPTEGSTHGLMDLVYTVEEGRTLDVLFGIVFTGGPTFPIAGQISVSDRNFLGTGKTVGAETNLNYDTQSLSLKYTDPWLFNKRWSGTVDLTWKRDREDGIAQDLDGNGIPDPYYSTTEYSDNNELIPGDNTMEYRSDYISTGFSTGYTWHTPVGRFGASTGLRSGFEYIYYDQNVYRPYSNELRDNYASWHYHDSINLGLNWDTRDITYDPNKGFFLNESFTYAGLAPQSTKNFLKSQSTFNIYATLLDLDLGTDSNRNLKSIMEFHTSFGYLFPKPWDSLDLDLDSDGFYVDGMFYGRGWNSISGGKSRWDGNLTMKFPIIPQILAADFFVDGVGLWASDEDLAAMTLQNFKFGMGGGFRFANPSFPIALYLVKKFNFNDDYTVNWDPEPDSSGLIEGLGLNFVLYFDVDLF